MDYRKVIEKINEELTNNGVKSIYALLTNNIDIEVIKNLIIKNTKEYNDLTISEQKKFINYLKELKLETQLIRAF